MLRVAVSIKAGKITPLPAILRRLGTYSSKNKLYFGFIELGKVIRTMFLLSYIGDVNLRKVIHAETNKVSNSMLLRAGHSLRRWGHCGKPQTRAKKSDQVQPLGGEHDYFA